MSRPRSVCPKCGGESLSLYSCTAHNNPDGDHLRAAHPQARGLPVLPMAQCLCRSDLTRNTRPSPTKYLGPKSPSSPAACALLHVEISEGAPGHISSGPVAQPARSGRNESFVCVQAIVQTTSRPTGGQPSPHPALTNLPSFISHFRDVFRPELCTTDQPSLSRSVLEPNLLGEDSSSGARGLIRSRP